MAEIALVKRVKYAGDVYKRLLEGGFDIDNAVLLLEGIPDADVAPVVHGRWEDSTDEWLGTDVYTCSKCRESYVLVDGTPKENLWNYCPTAVQRWTESERINI